MQSHIYWPLVTARGSGKKEAFFWGAVPSCAYPDLSVDSTKYPFNRWCGYDEELHQLWIDWIGPWRSGAVAEYLLRVFGRPNCQEGIDPWKHGAIWLLAMRGGEWGMLFEPGGISSDSADAMASHRLLTIVQLKDDAGRLDRKDVGAALAELLTPTYFRDRYVNVNGAFEGGAPPALVDPWNVGMLVERNEGNRPCGES